MKTATRERIGAATGIVAAALFGISFIVGLSPEPPDLNAPNAAWDGFLAKNQDAIRVEVLLNTLAMLMFLWFLGSVRAGLRGAEGGAGRVSAIASGGGLVGAAFVILAQVITAVAVLHPGQISPDVTRALIDLQALSIGLGATAFVVFFWAVAVATLMDGGMPKLIGYASILATVATMFGIVTIFTDEGVFAADGAFGFWVRYGVFVAWILLTSLVLVGAKPKASRR